MEPHRVQLPTPTPNTVQKAARKFEQDSTTNTPFKAVRLVFDQSPLNTDEAHVLAKVVVLNRLYSTNVYDVYAAAKQILACDTDRRLDAADLTLVGDIAQVATRVKPRRFYSFATKYCAFHRPQIYQIYDSQVDESLWKYKKAHAFADFKRQDLWNYAEFMRMIDAFRAHFELESCSRLELDRFLWNLSNSK